MKKLILKSCLAILGLLIGFTAFSQTSQTFNYTGGEQSWIVPPGVYSVHIEAWGAQGGFDPPTAGGNGGYAEGDLAVTPGQVLKIYVGGQGTSGPGTGQNCGLSGGYNGGGNTGTTCCSNAGAGAGAGGGASDVRIGGYTLTERVIVAAGGGGAGSQNPGAAGGGLVGSDGQQYNGVAATGGTQSAGGQPGGHFNSHTCSAGTAGTFGQGGIGDGNDGGGGGGGYYGGGGGANNAGGGGGSSYIDGVTSGATTADQRSGNGMVTLTWTPIAGVLYGADNQGNYFSINTANGVASVVNSNFVGTCNALSSRPIGVVTAIGYDPISGVGFGQEYDGCGSGFQFNAATGALTTTPSANTGNPPWFQGVSTYNGTWYTVGVASAPLSTFNPNTQILTTIGNTGLNLSGLAIDPITGIAYASEGQGGTNIYTINLSTGAATLLGSSGVRLGSLEFHNGILYGGGGQTNAGNIYTINTSTGAATLLGSTGLNSTITGLISTGLAQPMTCNISLPNKPIDPLYAAAGATDPNAYYPGLSGGKVFIANVTGGTAPYTYQWSTSSGTMNAFANKPNKAQLNYPTQAATVEVIITDAANVTCTATVSVPYIDFTCPPQPGMLWYYQLCNTQTNVSSCVHTTAAMRTLLQTGNYVFGTCGNPQKTDYTLEEGTYVVYPNPTSGIATMQYYAPASLDAIISIIDLNGRMLFSEEITVEKGIVEYNLDLSALSDGFYFVQLRTENDIDVQKIQVIR